MGVTVIMTTKTYSELIKIKTFEDRYEYLKIGGKVGEETFGCSRYLNQIFYSTKKWKQIRNYVIVRDFGRDLAFEGCEIPGRIIVHHLNPITKEDILSRSKCLFDLENLVCVSNNTHEAIHFGNMNILPKDPIERRPYDTCPWRRDAYG